VRQNAGERSFWIAGSSLLTVILVAFLFPPAWTQHPELRISDEINHEFSDMRGEHCQTAAGQNPGDLEAKGLADKSESELNHHLAGALLITAALFFLFQERLARRWSAVRSAWALTLLAAGFLLFVFSDTEIWPFGYQSFFYAVTHSLEVAQHKAFALILLGVGAVEFSRATGRVKGAWSALVFPVLGLGGAVLLLFHDHANMHGSDPMLTMVRVQSQHMRFAIVGAGIALTKGIAEVAVSWRRIFGTVWPVFMVVLGVLLLLYTE
jgi:putative copper resistance protein D